MVDRVFQIVNETRIVEIAGGELTAAMAAQAALPYAERAEAALAEIEDIASGAPDAPSVVNKLDLDGANLGPNGPALRTAMQVPRVVTTEQAISATAGATAAYAEALPFLYGAGSDISVSVDFSSATTNAERFDILEAAVNWRSSCLVGGRGRLKLLLPEGVIDCGAENLTINGQQGGLWFEAGAPDFIDIAGLSVSAVSGTVYTVTVTLATALPARVIVGCALGLQNVAGDNDARVFSGAAIVKTIAGDRLSFTYERNFYAAPTAPTSIATGTSFSLRQSWLVVPKTWVMTSGGSAAIEGSLFNLEGRAQVFSKYVSYVYNGTQTEGTTIAIKDGSRWHSVDFEVYAGGPERVLRTSADGNLKMTRACIGGDKRAAVSRLIDTQGSGVVELTRCSISGGKQAGINFGHDTRFYVASCIIQDGSEAAVWCIGAKGLLYPGYIGTAAAGVLADWGSEVKIDSGSSKATIHDCAVGLEWDHFSQIIGDATFSGNTADAQDAAQKLSAKGIWIQDSSLTLAVGGLTISASTPVLDFYDTDSLLGGQVSGAGGHLYVKSANNTRHVYFGTLSVPTMFEFNTASPSLLISASKVLGARKTGWAPATGTATRTTFATSTVTLPQLAERVKALIDDLHATAGHGLIGT